VGILTGLFGVGGGWLITPLLMMLGISPMVSVATGANQMVASATSGAYAHHKLGNVKNDRLAVLDIKKKVTVYQFDRRSGEIKELSPDRNLLDEAISYYQAANYLFEHGLNRF
jgi:hypothetical protein